MFDDAGLNVVKLDLKLVDDIITGKNKLYKILNEATSTFLRQGLEQRFAKMGYRAKLYNRVTNRIE